MMNIGYYILASGIRATKGHYSFAKAATRLAAFYRKSEDGLVLQGYIYGHLGGGNWHSTFHRVEFDAKGRILHHYRTYNPGEGFDYDGVFEDETPCSLEPTSEDTQIFMALHDFAFTWLDDEDPEVEFHHPIRPERHREFAPTSRRMTTWQSAQSPDFDEQAMVALCQHTGYLHSFGQAVAVATEHDVNET